MNKVMAKGKCEGSICVFLALVLLLIMSLILVLLESAVRSASGSYAHILLKSAEESVMGDYCGPLFADYHILALDSGFGNKSGDTDELERKIKSYMEENVWGFQNEELRVTGVRKMMDELGEDFFEQAADYEKYSAAQDVLEEILERVKNLGNQGTITKIMERKMDIESELSVMDKCTLDLMKMIDGVNLTLGTKTSSLLGFKIEEKFVKRFFVGENSMSGAGINNPSVYEKLKGKYVNPSDLLDGYIKALSENKKKLEEIGDAQDKYEKAEEDIKEYEQNIEEAEDRIEELTEDVEYLKELIKDCDEQIKESYSIEDKELAKSQKKLCTEIKKDSRKQLVANNKEIKKLKSDLSKYKSKLKAAMKTKNELEKKVSEARKVLATQVKTCNEKANALSSLINSTLSLLQSVTGIVEKAAKKQGEVRPMVEEYEKFLKVFSPVLSEDLKDGLEDSLDYMKAYVGMGDGRIKTTDFDSIYKTAVYDISVLDQLDMSAFQEIKKDVLEEVSMRLQKTEGMKDIFSQFSYSGFSFDYSEIKASEIENKLIAEFEKNISDGYLGLFLKPDTDISDNAMLSELLPSEWFEIFQNDDEEMGNLTDGADQKGGGALLDTAEEGSGISDISDLLEDGIDVLGKKFLSAMYMRHHFKSFRDRNVTGDTVLEYEVEYILSGFESDKANLSAALTKIMLMRLAICCIYTMTNKSMKAQAQALAVSILGFTGLPFLVTLVKYLILFLWAAAQAVVETAAIARGKKVPVITNDDSFCLTLAELPVFASKVSEKADSFYESNAYLDYDDYLLVMLLIQGKKTQVARAMDVIQENIRYKYDEDFLMNNAITSFSCEASFVAPSKYINAISGMFGEKPYYTVNVHDTVAY